MSANTTRLFDCILGGGEERKGDGRIVLAVKYLVLVVFSLDYCSFSIFASFFSGTASALRRIRFFTQAVTFTGSESEGYKAPTLNDIYENEIQRNSFPCCRLEKSECKEPTPSQLVIGVCFNRLSTERTELAPGVSAGAGRKERKRRAMPAREKGE